MKNEFFYKAVARRSNIGRINEYHSSGICKNNKQILKNTNKTELESNPEFEQTQKFPSRLRLFRSLRKNNKPNPKNSS